MAAAVTGSVGAKLDLRVRLGATLTPLLVTLELASGAIIDPDDTALFAFIYARETDMLPIAVAFDVAEVEPVEPDEPQRYLIELSKEKVAELVALPPAAPAPGTTARATPGVRTYWWTCFFEDSSGARRSVYYGKLTILIGATSA